jgi:hypothetical protein
LVAIGPPHSQPPHKFCIAKEQRMFTFLNGYILNGYVILFLACKAKNIISSFKKDFAGNL